MIAVLSDDSSSDSENAVSSVLRHVTQYARFGPAPQPFIPPRSPSLCSDHPYVTVIEISEPTTLAMARALSRLLPFPIPEAAAKEVVSQLCADVRSMSVSSTVNDSSARAQIRQVHRHVLVAAVEQPSGGDFFIPLTTSTRVLIQLTYCLSLSHICHSRCRL
jgi:hypothetical protein